MNLQLANTEEFIEGQFTGNLGEVLIRQVSCLLKSSQLCMPMSCQRPGCILMLPQAHSDVQWTRSGCWHDSLLLESLATPCRCNNVLYMRGVPEGDEDGEAKAMES